MKVLDFGLAKIGGRSGAVGELADAEHGRDAGGRDPRDGRLHEARAGARQDVDKRADIWAFGVVLYEMLTGRRLFRGEDISETLASVIVEAIWSRRRCASGVYCGDAWKRIRESLELGRRLRDIVASGTSVFLVDHDMGLVLSICDYIYVIEFGKKIAEGVPAEIRAQSACDRRVPGFVPSQLR